MFDAGFESTGKEGPDVLFSWYVCEVRNLVLGKLGGYQVISPEWDRLTAEVKRIPHAFRQSVVDDPCSWTICNPRWALTASGKRQVTGNRGATGVERGADKPIN